MQSKYVCFLNMPVEGIWVKSRLSTASSLERIYSQGKSIKLTLEEKKNLKPCWPIFWTMFLCDGILLKRKSVLAFNCFNNNLHRALNEYLLREKITCSFKCSRKGPSIELQSYSVCSLRLNLEYHRGCYLTNYFLQTEKMIKIDAEFIIFI